MRGLPGLSVVDEETGFKSNNNAGVRDRESAWGEQNQTGRVRGSHLVRQQLINEPAPAKGVAGSRVVSG